MREVEFKQLMILDGYNVIFKIAKLAGDEDRPLRAKRNALINFIKKWQQARSFKGKVCIVFDGRDGMGDSSQTLQGIDCFFTKTKEDGGRSDFIYHPKSFESLSNCCRFRR